MKRWIIGVTSLVVLVGLFVVLRPNDERAGPSPSPTGNGHDEGTTTSPGATVTGKDVPIVIGVKAGDVTGPGTATASAGDLIHLVVTADVTDEVHVHGYDVTGDVSPETPAHLEFVASTPGVYEVELEEAGLPLVEIRVEP